jgi:hypothetical protein
MSVTLTQDQVSAILQGVQAIASALQSPGEAPQSAPEPEVVQSPYLGYEERVSPSGAFAMRTYVNTGAAPNWDNQDSSLTVNLAGLPAHAVSTFGNLYVQ